MSSTRTSGAELVVSQLCSLDQEEVHRNAEKKIVHSVIKNIPFSIELALRGSFDPYVVDFHKFTLKCTLLYDTQGEERTVDWVKASPIDCVVQVNETGERATAEVRLQALSSQHEDMAFRIKFTAVPPATSDLAPLVVVSEPIKVVSKQSQLKKNKKPPATRTKKRPAPTADNEQIADSLARIEAQQRQQQALINSLIQTVAVIQQNKQAASVVDVGSPLSSHQDDDEAQQPKRKRVKAERMDLEQVQSPSGHEATQQFEHHLSGLLTTFAQLPSQERASCIQRVFRDYSDHAGEVVEALLAESLTKGEDYVDTPGATADLSSFDPLSYDSAYDLRSRPDAGAEAFYQQALQMRPPNATHESK